MRNIKVYKKGLLIGMSATLLLPNVTGCAKKEEVVETRKETEASTEDWIEKRMPKETKELSKEEIEKAAIDAWEEWKEDIETSLEQINNAEVTEKAKETIANTFIDMADFLFYGKAIKYGDKEVTLADLSETGKEKVWLIFSTVDSKIESKWPGYKEEVENKWSLGKGYLEEKANALKLYLLEKAKSHMTEEEYEKAGTYWDMFKEQTQKDLEEGKDLVNNLWDKGTDFAEEKYQEFKQKHGR